MSSTATAVTTATMLIALDPRGITTNILNLAIAIREQYEQMQDNKDMYTELFAHVGFIRNIAEALIKQQKEQIDYLKNSLASLKECLDQCLQLIAAITAKREKLGDKFKDFLKSDEDKTMIEKLTNNLKDFSGILSLALTTKIYENQIKMMESLNKNGVQNDVEHFIKQIKAIDFFEKWTEIFENQNPVEGQYTICDDAPSDINVLTRVMKLTKIDDPNHSHIFTPKHGYHCLNSSAEKRSFGGAKIMEAKEKFFSNSEVRKTLRNIGYDEYLPFSLADITSPYSIPTSLHQSSSSSSSNSSRESPLAEQIASIQSNYLKNPTTSPGTSVLVYSNTGRETTPSSATSNVPPSMQNTATQTSIEDNDEKNKENKGYCCKVS